MYIRSLQLCPAPAFGAATAVSAALHGSSSFSCVCWSFTFSGVGVVWSQVCGPSCDSWVWDSSDARLRRPDALASGRTPFFCHCGSLPCEFVRTWVGGLRPCLAPSWWWPCPLLRWALLTLSSYVLSVPSAVFFAVDPVALSPLLPHVFADGFRHWCEFRFCGGASPLAFGPVGPLGSCGGFTYFALQRAWLVSAILPWLLELRSVFHSFPA